MPGRGGWERYGQRAACREYVSEASPLVTQPARRQAPQPVHADSLLSRWRWNGDNEILDARWKGTGELRVQGSAAAVNQGNRTLR
jgi:hypothetical protein